MKIKVITTWNDRLYREYAHIFKETYNWNFPLVVYNEDKGMFDKIPELLKFVERNKDRDTSDFLQDAVRFSYKVFAWTDAILNEKADGLICIDADSRFYTPISSDWVTAKIHRNDCMMTYMGRGDQYTETGFLYFNMKHPDVRDYAREVQKLYITDELYKLPRTLDCEAWDHVRRKFEEERFTINYNIGDGKPGHVQARGVLGGIYDHMKGNRKFEGGSRENTRLFKV